MISPELLHTAAIGAAIVLGGIGSGIGQGIAGLGALQAMSRQTTGHDQIIRTMVLGLALIESGVILSLVITLMMLFGPTQQLTMGIGLAELGMGCAIGLSALAISIASSFAVKAACESIARQPFFYQKIITLMLLAQSIIGAPGVFAFIIALLIKANTTPTISDLEGIKYLAAGLTVGIGSIGPSIGQAIFAQSSCYAAGRNQQAYGKLLTFSLLSQAVIQTPLIFCLIIAIMIIYKSVAAIAATAGEYATLITSASCFAPGFAISVGSLGTAIAIGYAASKSSYYVVMDEENYPLFIRTSLLAQAIIESAAIYALIVALILVTKSI
ncbi:ATP synthase F0 subunit C [Candidatus Dependentiae bacterium]|nr:ATP synthase F0 subunit C [Candidatus Dependentiae bacterium]